MSKRIPVLAALLLLSCGCAAFLLSSPYDPAFDAAVTGFQKNTGVFFDSLGDAAGTPDGGWERFEPAYRSLETELDALTQQATVRPRNAVILQSLDLIRQNLATCEGLHRDGITPAEVNVVRRLVGTQVGLLLQLERARREPAKEGA